MRIFYYNHINFPMTTTALACYKEKLGRVQQIRLKCLHLYKI